MRTSSFALTFILVGTLAAGACVEPAADDVTEPLGRASAAQTVSQAASSGCSTDSVKGLSLQIIARAACDDPDSFVEMPSLPNVTMGSSVFPYLEKPARDALVDAANAKPGMHLGVNSMLRTIAQQYLLYHWYETGQCSIALAAVPGNSNHESGLAFDTSDYTAWKSTLVAHGFQWFGSADVVHYDYVGTGAVDERGKDVLAFQELWNDNHPDDPIAEDGDWGPQTEARMAQSPADGFPMPVQCDPMPPEAPDVFLSEDVVGGSDLFSDGSSHGIPDAFEGDAETIAVRLVNEGKTPATMVEIGVELDGSFLSVDDYLVESDWMNGGAFKENDANTLPANPPHGTDPGASFALQLNQLSPGETKRVTFTVHAKAYSVDHPAPAGLRIFVKEIPGHYEETSFGGDVTNTDGAQTFNGGRLEIAGGLDVYSHTRWEWDSDRLEGFTASNGAAVETTGGALVLSGGSAGAYALSPAISIDPASAKLTLKAKRTGGSGAARVAVLTTGETDPSHAKVVDLELPADDSFHRLTVDLGASGAAGSITGFAIIPFDGSAGTMEIDSASFDGESISSGDAPGAGDASGDLEGSCACRAAGRSSGGSPAFLAAGAAAVALALRARTRRSTPGR